MFFETNEIRCVQSNKRSENYSTIKINVIIYRCDCSVQTIDECLDCRTHVYKCTAIAGRGGSERW